MMDSEGEENYQEERKQPGITIVDDDSSSNSGT